MGATARKNVAKRFIRSSQRREAGDEIEPSPHILFIPFIPSPKQKMEDGIHGMNRIGEPGDTAH